MISLFLPFIISAAIGSLDPMAVSDPTVSGSDFVVSEDIQVENESDLILRDSIKSISDIKVMSLDLSKAVSDYENDLYVGWNYFTYSTSTGVTFTVLCNGYNCTSISYSNYDQCYNAYFDISNKIVTFDVNGTYYQKFNYGSSSVKLNFDPLNFTDRSVTIRLVGSGIVKEVSSGGGEDPNTPTVSGGNYADILQSIDDRLSYFEDLFYYGSSLDDMGDGFKIIIVLIFLVTINIVLKIINWR